MDEKKLKFQGIFWLLEDFPENRLKGFFCDYDIILLFIYSSIQEPAPEPEPEAAPAEDEDGGDAKKKKKKKKKAAKQILKCVSTIF